METVTAGLALFDYDGDGDEDIYFLNGAFLADAPEPRPRNALYRNDGDWRFTDVSASAGVDDPGFGLGVCTGDYDNDGHADLFVANFGQLVLYRNRGDGTFTNATTAAGLGAVISANDCPGGCALLDMDNDGDLDLYVAMYLRFDPARAFPCTEDGVPIYCGPNLWDPVPDVLMRNNGDGTFTDVSETSGIRGRTGYGMGLVCADYDDDGDTDIFVANDVVENFLLQNDGRGHFKDVSRLAGTAVDVMGRTQGSMGVECADVDGDGRLDFYLTSFEKETACLYRGLGDGLFQDLTRLTGAGQNTFTRVTWGTVIADFDNDADRDLFVAAGHLQDLVERYDTSTTYKQSNALLFNDGAGRFVDVSSTAGPGLGVVKVSRGAAAADLDNDGDLDLVILNVRSEPTLLRNDGGHKGHWLQVSLHGTKSNRSGIGARVIVHAAGRTYIDEVRSGRGYQSDYGKRLHFGLGSADRIERIDVRWPSGQVDTLTDVAIDQHITITEGSGQR